LGLAAPLGAYLLLRCGPALLWFGGGALFGLYAYTGPPLQLKYRSAGEAVIFVVFGPLLVTGAAYAQLGRWDWGALLLSLPVGLLTTAVLLGNNIRDLEEDDEAQIRTLAHGLGPRLARTLYAGAVLAPPVAVAALVAAGQLGPGALLCVVSLVPGYRLVRRSRGAVRMPDVDARTARVATLFLLTLLVGLTLS
ncbi:MAG: prenyltransferase, partial [Planctomycetota bacterium]